MIGNGELKDDVPSMEPVRPHAGVNMAGPPTLDRNAGSQLEKGQELGVIIREERRGENGDASHFSVVLLLYSITEMRGGVMGEGLQACPADFRVVFLFRLGESVKTGREG